MGSSIHKSGKASKPPDRSRPNLTHICRFIWEWKSAKQINLSSPKGYEEGVRGSHIKNVWERCQTAGPIGTKYGTRMHINLEMDMSSKLTPRYPWGMGVRASSIHKSGKASKPLDRSGHKFGTRIQIHQGMDIG